MPGQPLKGVAAVVALGSWLRGALPDLQLAVEEVVSAEDHHVLLYYTAQGTNTGPLQPYLHQQQQQQQQATASASDSASQPAAPSLPASGKPVSWTGSLVLRLEPAATGACNPTTGSGSGGGSASSTSGSIGSSLKVISAWHSWDPLFMYQQIGAVPCTVPSAPPAAPAAAPCAESIAVAGDSEDEVAQSKAVVKQYFETYNTG